MNEVGFTVSQCIDFVKNIQQQANDVIEIKTLMTTHKYNIFTTALKRIGNALTMLSNVFTNIDNDHNKLFEFNNLKLSQIETIGVKLAPIQELFDLLAELYFYNSHRNILEACLKDLGYYLLHFHKHVQQYNIPSLLFSYLKRMYLCTLLRLHIP